MILRVPFFDLKQQLSQIKEEIQVAINKTLQESQFIRGKAVFEFEKTFAERCGAKYCIGVANGTDALYLSLLSCGISSGDEVITPAFSWISSASSITRCGAVPVFADVLPNTYTIDPDEVLAKITNKTRAVIIVHLFGQLAAVEEIKKICDNQGIALIEDCAQAHLASVNNKIAGTFGHAGTFSFYPTKNLGALGDAGCVITNDGSLAELIRRNANHGALQKNDHQLEGINSRLDTLQAAILLAKLPHLKKWNDERNNHALLYKSLLSGIDNITLPQVNPEINSAVHLFVIRAKKRDALKKYLSNEGIETIIHYPSALTNLPVYSTSNQAKGAFPVSTELQNEVLSLPLYPEIPVESLHYVAKKIRNFYMPEQRGS